MSQIYAMVLATTVLGAGLLVYVFRTSRHFAEPIERFL